MKLEELVHLYKSMKNQGIERYKFDFSFNNVRFDVIYFIDENPHKLAFGIKLHNYYFEIPVRNGFEITPFLKEYNRFCRIMGFEYNPNAPFRPKNFFEAFRSKIPGKATAQNIPAPHQIAVYRNDIEEADKIYFVKWRNNKKIGHKVSEKNLEKTRKLLSFEAYKMCKSKNVSSCWSSDSNDARPFN